MKRLAAMIGALLALGVVIVLVRTIRFTSRQVTVEPVVNLAVAEEPAADHLAQALTFRTISHQDPARFEAQPFLDFLRFLETTYTGAHRVLTKELINNYSLLYSWPGVQPELQPIILMAHMDVVPVVPGSEGDWAYPPYGGEIADGFIWGRGAIDDKASLVGIMEAMEILAEEGFQPQRTIYLAFGHDEEIGGLDGAVQIANLLESRGLQAAFILDEGWGISEGIIPGVSKPVAGVAIAEKGYFTVELTVQTAGGHSSMPPPHTGVGILSRAITRLEANQRPAAIRGPVRQMFETLGPEMSFFNRIVFANLWLFGPLVKSQLAGSPRTNAMIRTTTAATMIQGSAKENILPITSRAVVNFRLLPGDSSAAVLEHMRRVVDDPQVEINVLGFVSEPSLVSDVTAPSYKALERTIREVFPEVLVAPLIFVAATDSRHFEALSSNIYRFAPSRLTPADVPRIHGTNERISVRDFGQIVAFYVQLLRNTATEQ